MSGKFIRYGIALFILTVVFVGNHAALGDGLPEEEALPTTRPLEKPLVPETEVVPPLPPAPVELVEEVVEALAPEPDFWSVFSKGMILFEPKPDGKIVASPDQRTLLGEGDIVYLTSFRGEFIPEVKWIVFKTIKDVYHPKTDAFLGDLIHVLGMVQIIDADEDIATARIIHSREPISPDDLVASVQDLFGPADLPDKSLPEKTEATIVEVRDERLSNARHDIVYIDQGKKDGIVRGDHFAIIHGGKQIKIRSPRKKIALPQREVGRLVVLSTQDLTATALIVESVEPIFKGDPILYLSSR